MSDFRILNGTKHMSENESALIQRKYYKDGYKLFHYSSDRHDFRYVPDNINLMNIVDHLAFYRDGVYNFTIVYKEN